MLYAPRGRRCHAPCVRTVRASGAVAVQYVNELQATRRLRHVRIHAHWRVLRTARLSVDFARMLLTERAAASVELAGCPRGVAAPMTGAKRTTADEERNGSGLRHAHGFVFPVLMIHDHKRECAYGCGTRFFGR